MKLKVNKAMCEATYTYLTALPPFNRWNLPDAADVDFRVNNSNVYGACHAHKHKRPTIWISAKRHATVNYLLQTMAHEMIHLYQGYHGMKQTSDHDDSFRLLFEKMAMQLGFDPKGF